jgi:uncharacterized protein YprB with RNaseH-like and TPR domain
MKKLKHKGPRVLFLDIETAPILAHVWNIWQENIGLNQIKKDWHILSWAAKWQDSDKMLYQDNRKSRNIEDDRKILKGIWTLLNEADIVITHNGKRFDTKKLNARFVINDFQPPSSFKQIDTLQIAKQQFGFTSNKLEHLADKLKVKHKKYKHKKFSGFALWEACLAGVDAAWKEMEKYNKQDVLALEGVYDKLIPWSNGTINFNLYSDSTEHVCKCGSTKHKKNGLFYTSSGRYQRYKCSECGSESRDGKNLLSKEKRSSLKRNTVR